MSGTIITAYLPALRADIEDTLRWSRQTFGSAAADRYRALIGQSLRDLIDDPLRPGSRSRPDLALNAYVYHLQHSRDRVHGDQVKAPRHFVLYRLTITRLEIARLLHDSRDLQRHLPPALNS